MPSYVDGYKQEASGKFLQRYATASKISEISEKDEFNSQYKKGTVHMRLASRYMVLKPCGLNLYIEADKKVVWSRNDDSIVRQNVDLDWLEELFENDGMSD